MKFLILFPALAFINLAASRLTFRFIEQTSMEFGRQVIRRWNDKAISRTIDTPASTEAVAP
jgi:hypothetical protein